MFAQLPRVVDAGNPVNVKAPLNRNLFAWWIHLPAAKPKAGAAGTSTYNTNGVPTNILKSTTITNTTNTTISKVHRPGGWGSVYHQAGRGSTGLLQRTWQATGGYTLAAWARPTNISTDQYLTNFSTGNLLAVILGYQEAKWNIFEGSYASGGSTEITATINEWQHIVFTRNASRVQGYFNGVLKVDVTHSWGSPGTPTQTHIQTASSTGLSPFYGYVDDVRLYNRQLFPTDVASLYKASLTGYRRELNWLDRPWLLNTAASQPSIIQQYPIFDSFISNKQTNFKSFIK